MQSAKKQESKPEATPGALVKELTKNFELAEQRVDEIKSKLAQLEQDFANPEYIQYANKMKTLREQYETQRNELKQAEADYNQAFEKLMEAQNTEN